MNHFRRRASLASLTSAVVLAISVPTAVSAQADEELATARSATEAFRDPAAAEAAGYGLPPEGPLHACISALEGSGAMGLHYINGDLVGDTELDPATPEALVYAPTADGGLELVALEYVVFAEAWDEANDAPPMLFEQQFMFTDEPNRYELPPFYALHAWVWKENPDGMFAGFNPDVSCTAGMPNTAVPERPIGPLLTVLGLSLLAVGSAMGIRHQRRRIC